MRMERDSLGEKPVPEDAYYGVHTVRSLENFDLSGEKMPLEIIFGMVKLKWACARANATAGLMPRERKDAITDACRKVLAGQYNDQFPLDIFQSGSGTSSNMNVNEVLANLANEILGGAKGDKTLVHPNDDVNQGQSTNNVFPSGAKIAAVELGAGLLAQMQHLRNALRQKEAAFQDVYKSGRTHLQDAVPMTLGHAFGAYVRAIEKDIKRVDTARNKLKELGVGGTAIGTGVNTRRDFRALVIRELSKITNELYEGALVGMEATQFLTDMAELSAALKLASLDLQKICNDLRLLASGPNTGFNEIRLPAVEPGSSIMPGKINPSICEAVNMACIQVQACDYAVAAAAGAGQLELNTHMPVLAANLVKAIKLLTRACAALADKCIAGIDANREVCRNNFERSASLATILNPKLGYDRVAVLVKEALATHKTLRELVREKQLMSENELDDLLKSSIGPNLG